MAKLLGSLTIAIISLGDLCICGWYESKEEGTLQTIS